MRALLNPDSTMKKAVYLALAAGGATAIVLNFWDTATDAVVFATKKVAENPIETGFAIVGMAQMVAFNALSGSTAAVQTGVDKCRTIERKSPAQKHRTANKYQALSEQDAGEAESLVPAVVQPQMRIARITPTKMGLGGIIVTLVAFGGSLGSPAARAEYAQFLLWLASPTGAKVLGSLLAAGGTFELVNLTGSFVKSVPCLPWRTDIYWANKPVAGRDSDPEDPLDNKFQAVDPSSVAPTPGSATE